MSIWLLNQINLTLFKLKFSLLLAERKCCGYGHYGHDCYNKLRCSQCGGNHKFKEYNKLNKQPKSINCIKIIKFEDNGTKDKCHHNAFSKYCIATEK